MDFLSHLWMPIVVSAVLVWFASFLMHMVLPHHKGEFKGLPDEPKALAALEGVQPGQYMFPWGSMADMKNPEFIAKQEKGPCGHMTIWAGRVNMGKNMMLSLLFYLVVSVFVAYLSSHAIPAPEPFMKILQIAGCAAFMAYGLGMIPHMIWFQVKGFWSYLFDNLVYALITGAVFGWMWH